jgi:hypothetical protein
LETRHPDECEELIGPGWFPDPEGSAHFRYWDGQRWTRDLATSSPVTLAAMATATRIPPAGPVVDEMPLDPAALERRDPWTWLAIVTAIGAVIAVAACVVVARSPRHTVARPSVPPAPLAASAPAAVAPAPTGDQGAAQRSLLLISDLPSGWTAAPATPSTPDDAALNARMASCLGVPVSQLSPNVESADTPEFDAPGGLPTVQDSVQVFPSTTSASADFGLASSPKTPSCFTDVLGAKLRQSVVDGLRPGQTAGSVSTSRGPLNGFGAQIEAIDTVLPITQGAIVVPCHITEFVVVVGRVESTVTVSWLGRALPVELGHNLLNTVVQRMGGGAQMI